MRDIKTIEIPKQIDVGIITVLPEVELPAIKRAFNIIDKNTEPNNVNDRDYWFKNIESKGSTLCIAITTAEKGNEKAKGVTKDFITNFNPEVVMLVGIAAGVKSEVALGDVVISEEVCYYEPSKLTSKGVQPRWLSEKPGDSPLFDIKTFSRNRDALDDWHDNFHRVEGKLKKEGLPDPPGILHPKIHFGTIASGEKIIADGSLQKTMHDQIDGNIRAGETEGWGFLRAAIEKKKDWIVIRGISDFGDEKTKDGKNKDRYHHSAANAAATFALTFLKSGYSPQYKEDINEASNIPIDSAEGHKPLPKKSEINPWILFNKPIELSSLSKENFWTTVADDNTKTLKLRIILPSGKFEGAIGQLPLISDGMFLPEIIASIANLIKETGLRLDVKTLFDIDVVHKRGGKFELQKDILSDCNLILTATGDVNLATRLLLKHESLFNKRPGPASPESSLIYGINEEYDVINNPDLGFLSVFRSPFNDERIGIFTCGTYAIGTLGAQKLLNLYIEGKATIGNNRINREIPAKIVNFTRTQYPFQLLDLGSTVPKIELRNINVQDLIDAVGVKE